MGIPHDPPAMFQVAIALILPVHSRVVDSGFESAEWPFRGFPGRADEAPCPPNPAPLRRGAAAGGGHGGHPGVPLPAGGGQPGGRHVDAGRRRAVRAAALPRRALTRPALTRRALTPLPGAPPCQHRLPVPVRQGPDFGVESIHPTQRPSSPCAMSRVRSVGWLGKLPLSRSECLAFRCCIFVVMSIQFLIIK